MAPLVEETAQYMAQNIPDIVRLPIDMQCVNDWLLKKIADKTDLHLLDTLNDKKDKLKERIFMKKVDALLTSSDN